MWRRSEQFIPNHPFWTSAADNSQVLREKEPQRLLHLVKSCFPLKPLAAERFHDLTPDLIRDQVTRAWLWNVPS